ncbi:hypothetical protein F4779DRAFT_579884 [Xylariaceae sp. FL0662B]|nr:hypothetical protein F4779DRAFT_579884 [Xylariaceae sp. FL0662B]
MPPIVTSVDVILEYIWVGVQTVMGVYAVVCMTLIVLMTNNINHRERHKYLLITALSTAFLVATTYAWMFRYNEWAVTLSRLQETREFLQRALNQPLWDN